MTVASSADLGVIGQTRVRPRVGLEVGLVLDQTPFVLRNGSFPVALALGEGEKAALSTITSIFETGDSEIPDSDRT